MRELVIDNRRIGLGHPCFVIAEAGVNHNGELDLALRLVDAAAEARADAVKFQTFSAETLVSPQAPQFPYARPEAEGALSQREMLERLELPRELHEPIKQRCAQRGIMFLSTPFHENDADWLDAFGVPAFKLPSGEITNMPFLRHVAAKGKPIILSTGMATLAEVEHAVQTIRECGNERLAVLHCVSDYPANPADVNLRAMATMERAFGVPVGFSDHTLGIEVPLAAVALGACVIEKHFTLDSELPGPDHRASLEPPQLTALVNGIRIVEASLGSGRKEPVAAELRTLPIVRKSIVAARKLAAGEEISREKLAVRRPGTGLAPDMAGTLVGRRVKRDLEAGHVITRDDVS